MYYLLTKDVLGDKLPAAEQPLVLCPGRGLNNRAYTAAGE